jgi:exodeoxyribonuclease VII large subunit
LPARIGIVTSLDGAALRDIIKVLTRRHPNVRLLIRPTRVQGDGAAAEIADAVRAIGRVPGVDVVIVGRGGGSAEDLWPFNQEPVARAIAGCPVPVVTAVGHEVDITIADFVADVRAPTPSAAAEMVMAAHEELGARLDRQTRRLRAALAAGLDRRRTRLHVLVSRRGLAGFPARLAMRGRYTADLTHQLRSAVLAALTRREREFRALRLRLEARDVGRRLEAIRGRVDAARGRLQAAVLRRRDRAAARASEAIGRLESLSPLAVLGRGYAVCWTEDRSTIVRSASRVGPGDRVHVTLHQGELSCTVDARHERESGGPGAEGTRPMRDTNR